MDSVIIISEMNDAKKAFSSPTLNQRLCVRICCYEQTISNININNNLKLLRCNSIGY